MNEVNFYCDDVLFIRPWPDVPTIGQEIVLGGLTYQIDTVRRYPRVMDADFIYVRCSQKARSGRPKRN